MRKKIFAGALKKFKVSQLNSELEAARTRTLERLRRKSGADELERNHESIPHIDLARAAQEVGDVALRTSARNGAIDWASVKAILSGMGRGKVAVLRPRKVSVHFEASLPAA